MDQPLTDAATSAIARYGAITLGVLLGIAARYGLMLNEGKRLTWRGIFADLLLLGALTLLAVEIADWAHLTGNARVLIGALSGTSGDRLVRLAHDKFNKQAESQLAETAKTAPGVTTVPAGAGEPDRIVAQPLVDDSTPGRVGASLREVFRRPMQQRPPEDQIDALRRLDQHD